MSTIDQLPSSAVCHDPRRNARMVQNVATGRMTWVMPWSDYEAFVEVVVGLEEQVTFPGGVVVTRRVPLKYPWPLQPDMYANEISLDPCGTPGSSAGEGIEYSKIKVTVGFTSFDFFGGQGDFPLVSMQMRTGAVRKTRPGTAYKFPSDNLLIDHPVGVRIPTREVALTMHWMPPISQTVLDLWESLAGKVNSGVFRTPWGTYAAGCVLYDGSDASQTLTVGNQIQAQATHRMLCQRIPHNQLMRPDGTAFESPVDFITGAGLYEAVDLNALYV
jgi:hypothetical protein